MKLFGLASRDFGGVPEERPAWDDDPSQYPITAAGFATLLDWGLDAPTTTGSDVDMWDSPASVIGYNGNVTEFYSDASPAKPQVGVTDKPNAKDYASKFAFLEADAERLETVKTWIIAVDNDEPGKRLEDELARRLGREKCKRVTWASACYGTCVSTVYGL
jgi:hypothetical protein